MFGTWVNQVNVLVNQGSGLGYSEVQFRLIMDMFDLLRGMFWLLTRDRTVCLG